ncbi:glucans biosynthesis glucosyltransferase MdoH [Paraglaciecola chathamensis]|nr:glucans biosynthesis glucosyltransferase MdoH [Paraglaciecola chathamensis]
MFIDIKGKAVRKWIYAVMVFITSITGSWMMYEIFSESGITTLEVVLLILFSITFLWISAAFWSACIGFILQIFDIDPLKLSRNKHFVGQTENVVLKDRHAVVMPVYNEDTNRIMAGFEACLLDMERTGQLEHFDFYMLSDTQDPDMAQAELTAWNALCQRVGVLSENIYYRRREKNLHRKVGNLADFCQRWGYQYESMIVLDADSIMTGECMLTLVKAMQQNPMSALIQTVPIPVRSQTLFGRFLQFASCLYCPMLATGQAFWQTDSANYWGHNAIIRVDAFIQHCGLPTLKGKAPFGGDILSHDFVEAALLRRAGWDVLLLADLEGSYEEIPSNIIDYATRDRRWVQGNIQHLGIINGKGLHTVNRLHFLFGALAYMSSLVWLVMLVLSTIDAVVRATTDTVFFASNYSLFPSWPVVKTEYIITLISATVIMLLGPKLLGAIVALVRRREQFGGGLALMSGALIEAVIAIIIAPLMMFYHAYFVLNVLVGKNVSWDAQGREGRMVPWKEAFKRTWAASAIAIIWGGITLSLTPILFWWLAPVLLGLLMAAPIIRFSSSLYLGKLSRSLGMFVSPSEVEEVPALSRLRIRLANMQPQDEVLLSCPPMPAQQWQDMPQQSFAYLSSSVDIPSQRLASENKQQ